MPWLKMDFAQAEAFDAEMLVRCATIRGKASRYSWPEAAIEKDMFAVLVAPEHVGRLSVSVRNALLAAKPAMIGLDAIDPPVAKPGGRALNSEPTPPVALEAQASELGSQERLP